MAVYVMSDIHGLKQRFHQMLERIALQAEDTLYIIGDVIDRGLYGIELLQEIRKDKRMVLMMGNHEHMMLEYYDALERLRQGEDDGSSMEWIYRWDMNHNRPTKDAFEALPQKEQKELLEYLRHLPLAFPDIQVNGRHFYLVHANWDPAFLKDPVYLEDCAKACVNHIHLLWDRIDAEYPMPKDKTLIFGHTVTMFFQQCHPYQIWTNGVDVKEATFIDIDCGCAANNQDTQLACIRLDDMEVFYV